MTTTASDRTVLPSGYVWLTADEVSDAISVPAETLRGWRRKGVGPRFAKLPNAQVRYRADQVETYLSKLAAA